MILVGGGAPPVSRLPALEHCVIFNFSQWALACCGPYYHQWHVRWDALILLDFSLRKSVDLCIYFNQCHLILLVDSSLEGGGSQFTQLIPIGFSLLGFIFLFSFVTVMAFLQKQNLMFSSVDMLSSSTLYPTFAVYYSYCSILPSGG